MTQPPRDQYPSNNKDTNRPDQDKVVSGKVIRKKRSKASTISKTMGEIMSTIFTDVLMPAAKDMFFDAVTQGTERAIYGDTTPRRSSRPSQQPQNRLKQNHINYNRYSGPNTRPERMKHPVSRGYRNGFDDTIFESRREAEDVLDRMYDLISEFDYATVGDFYSLIGTRPSPIDRNWGWTDLGGSDIRKTRDGFVLSLPAPAYLD